MKLIAQAIWILLRTICIRWLHEPFAGPPFPRKEKPKVRDMGDCKMQTTMQFIGGPINRTVQFEQCKKLPETDDLDIIAAWSIYTLTNNGTVGLATDKLSLNYIYKIEHQENKNGVFVKAESFLRLFVQPRDFLCKSHLLCKAHVGYA